MSSREIIDFGEAKEKNRIKKRDEKIEKMVEDFRQDLPGMIENRRNEAERVGEYFPTLEELLNAENGDIGLRIPKKVNIKAIGNDEEKEDYENFKKFLNSELCQIIIDL